MNKSFVTSLLLGVVLSNAASVLYADSPNGTTPELAPIQPQENDLVAVTSDSPPVSHAPFLLKLILNDQANIRDRLEAVRSLGDNLSRSEMDSFYCFLKSHPGFKERNLPGLRALKNDLLNALKEQSGPPVGLTTTLIDIFHDHAQDFVTRDYAIQHLTMWYKRSGVDVPDAKERIQAALKEALRENSSIAGTALLGLHRLSLGDKSFDGAEIDRSALGMATASDTILEARITAIQICAERGLVKALPAIEHFAQAQGQTALQISAISALGRLGGPEQTALLRRFELDNNKALGPAIDAALKQLDHAMVSRSPF